MKNTHFFKVSITFLFALLILNGSELKAQSNWEAGIRFGDNFAIDATIPLGMSPRLHPAVYFDRFGVGAYFDGDVKIPHGDIRITLKHTMKEPRLNGPSTVEFFISDDKVGAMDIIAMVYAGFTGHETFDIGRDEGMPVNEEYAHLGKFEFTPGQLHKVVFDIE